MWERSQSLFRLFTKVNGCVTVGAPLGLDLRTDSVDFQSPCGPEEVAWRPARPGTPTEDPRAVFDLIRSARTISRVDLAAATGLTRRRSPR